MLIQIDADQQVRGTEYCWQIERRRRYKGEERWEPYKYFGTLRQALDEALQREIRLHPASTLAEQIEAADQLVAKYTALFDRTVK